jgi:hypothetical protein
MGDGEQPFAIRPLEWDLPDSHWPMLSGKRMVFIERYVLPADAKLGLGVLGGAALYLFGGLVPCGAYTRVEYKVVEVRAGAGSPIEHHLRQSDGDGTFYSSDAEHADAASRHREFEPARVDGQLPPDFFLSGEVNSAARKLVGVFNMPWSFSIPVRDEYIAAGRPKNVGKWMRERLKGEYRWLARRPRWLQEGEWAFFRGRPMVFVGQTVVPRNERTYKRLSTGEMLYIFAGGNESESAVKVYFQFVGEQTAEQHYAVESLVMEFLERPGDADVIARCVEEGGRDVQEFMLAQDGLGEAALKLLSVKGTNKEIRDTAKKRLSR